jgi:DUF4097 and DUF4098 domain-containing protein YvlB
MGGGFTMTSRHSLTILAILIWAAVAVTAAPRAFSRHRLVSATPSADFPINGCSDFGTRFDGHDAVYKSEDRSVTKSEASVLDVQADSNGGIYIEGWDKDDYSITLCKAAEAGTDADSILSQIHLTFSSGAVRITAPASNRHWAAHLLIRAPKASAMDVKIHNGPLTLTHVDGNLKVRAENGPVTVSACTGELDLSSQNGPVTLEQNSGKQSIHAENGPVTLTLSGHSWNGAGLEASSQNGPVTLEVPSGYKSGVLLKSEGHSPFECSSSVCSEGRKTWDDDHKMVEFGSGPTVIKVSSVNGPVSVL